MVDILEQLQNPRTSLGTLWPQPNLHEEAAEKIIQLRKELDETKRAADAFVENEHLREELAAMERRARMFEAANEKMLADNKRLREENARLREELQRDFNAMRVFARYRELEAEIETLRGLLREAHVKMDANNLWSNLRNRVAAAIQEGGKDE